MSVTVSLKSELLDTIPYNMPMENGKMLMAFLSTVVLKHPCCNFRGIITSLIVNLQNLVIQVSFPITFSLSGVLRIYPIDEEAIQIMKNRDI